MDTYKLSIARCEFIGFSVTTKNKLNIQIIKIKEQTIVGGSKN